MKNIKLRAACGILFIVGLMAFAAWAQDTNTPPKLPPLPDAAEAAVGVDLNLFTAMIAGFFKTPANLLLILGVSVLAWLWEITPRCNSKYIPHLCVFLGTVGYPLLADKSAIPASYPHPFAVMILSGIIVGAIAAAVHKPIMRKLGVVPPAVGLLVACLGLTGCDSLVKVAPGADPVVVVAEWTAENSANAIDQFLAWERNNDALLRRKAPGLHAVADQLRDTAAADIKNLRTITKAYRQERTPERQGQVQAATNLLLALSNSVLAHMGLPPLVPPVVTLTPSATDLMQPVTGQ